MQYTTEMAFLNLAGTFQTMIFVEPFQLADHLPTFLFKGNQEKTSLCFDKSLRTCHVKELIAKFNLN